MILPAASCVECAAITSRFERQVARNVLGPYRARSGAPTRRPKDRPTKLPLELVEHDGSRREIEVESSAHPGTLLLPYLPEPTVLVPALQSDRRKLRMFLAVPDMAALKFASEHGAAAMHLGPFEIGCFYKLFAKIAHAGAFFFDPQWTSTWRPLLPELILERADDYDKFVGGTDVDEFEDDDASFPLIYRNVDVAETRYLVAFFKLFGPNRTPIYQVVTGSLDLASH